MPLVAEWPELDRLAAEAEAIGFHMTAHPLDAYAGAMRRLDVVSSADLEKRAGQRVRVAGLVVAVKERTTRTGSRMAWVRLSDTDGSFEVTLFSEVLARSRELIGEGTPLLVTADLKREGDALRITANDVASAWTRRRRRSVASCASGSTRRRRCGTSARCSRARGRGGGRWC